MKLVIVESPSKAKSIGKYLGKDYKVLASYGHIRDLPSKTGSVRPQEDFAMTWSVIEKAEKALQEIRAAIPKSDELLLATDPDREGEAISWHVLEYLKEQDLLKHQPTVKRVVFNAVTKSAVLEAFKHPREVDTHLVDAYLARLSLDYLVGFTLSPVLWRKLPGSRSAGRVQSVALRLVAEREKEIEAFKKEEYWTVEASFGVDVTLDLTLGAAPGATHLFPGKLIHWQGKKLEKFSLPNETLARQALGDAEKASYTVLSLEKKRVKRNPQPPFITSTLQQEASRKLGFSASRTMKIAQKLYEGLSLDDGEVTGLITYMRTDSIQVIPEATEECRQAILDKFGKAYLPDQVRVYKSKAKNAQEAHEAIRPTDYVRSPETLKAYLDTEQLKLYELIWKRAVASQMEQAQLDQTTVDIASEDQQIIFRSTGSIIAFDGFLKLYQESYDEGEGEDAGKTSKLPKLQEKQPLTFEDMLPYQHFTQPPPRYTEASLVKKLEELGIGRPSTYARILQVLQDRSYVRLEKRQMVPEERGRIVTAFLTHFFERYVQYGFTADLEDQLDAISAGSTPWKHVLQAFWDTFSQTIEASSSLTIPQVIETVEKDLKAYLFPGAQGDAETASAPCPQCQIGNLGLRLGKINAFLGCSRYPDCTYTRSLSSQEPSGEIQGEDGTVTVSPTLFPRAVGQDPETNLEISIRMGPYGPYLQWGEGPKPKRVSLSKDVPVDQVTLEQALRLGALPKTLGAHPTTQEDLVLGLGRFGPYIKYQGAYFSLKKNQDYLKFSLEEAVQLVEEGLLKKKKAPPKAFGKKK
jgi:DNA topoisomerase I